MTEARILKNFVNGEYTDTRDGQGYDLVNPSTGEVSAQAPASREADVDHAFGAARMAFEGWRDTTPAERQLALIRIADALEVRAEEFMRAEAENTGKPVELHMGEEIPMMLEQIRFFLRGGPLSGGQVRRGVHGRAHVVYPARTHRRLRPDNAVELPAAHGDLEVRPSDSCRQHRGLETFGHHPADHPDAGGVGRGVPAARGLKRDLRR